MKKCSYCGCENDDEAVQCRECATTEFVDPTSPPLLEPEPPRHNIPPLPPGTMHLDLVTLVTCRTLQEADLIVGQLEAQGISALIPDEYLMQAVSWNLNTYGYVRVQVSPKDYEAARAFLNASD